MRPIPTSVKLAVILALALGIRLIAAAYVAPYPDRFIYSDAVGYDQIARNLVAGNGFSMSTTPPFAPDNFRTPGYPAILASVYSVFGYRPEYVLYLQAFAGMLACLVAFAVGAVAGNKSIGLVAAGLVAINPHSVTYASLLWSDVIYALLIATATLSMILMFSKDRIEFVLLAGFTLGVATLVHPRSFLLVMLPCAFLVGLRFKSGSLRKGIFQAAVYTAAFMLPLAPWMLRNQATFGVPNLSAAAGTNMLYYAAALTEARRTGEDQWIIAQRLGSEILNSSPEPLNEAELSSLALRRGIELISDDPGSYAAVQLIGMGKVFMPGTLSARRLITGIVQQDGVPIYELLISSDLNPKTIWKFIQETPIPVLLVVAMDSALLLAMLGAWLIVAVRPHRRQLRFSMLLSFIILYLASVAGPAGAPRFRVAFVPLLAVLAAAGFQALTERGSASAPRANLSTTRLDQRPI